MISQAPDESDDRNQMLRQYVRPLLQRHTLILLQFASCIIPPDTARINAPSVLTLGTTRASLPIPIRAS